ncbi:AMP-binding protein [Parafrankia sp. EUN1f]|uniref:AMP-binding protein n=1 Tax=Parafrankia sp. EUN1f TaxID=102897 RepID=UPI0001C46847|nr:AMP-binding protein [Parafrankia sp. EUN1f]EFC80838.1 AMP-dependent synthetase and ligase [Parafrankia sp. EUN1f]
MTGVSAAAGAGVGIRLSVSTAAGAEAGTLCGVPFARDLRRHGSALAVVSADGQALTYDQLADRVDEVGARLGPGRRLVMIAASDGLEPLVTYLAALAGGHPVLFSGPDDRSVEPLVSVYDPDVLLRQGPPGWRLAHRRPGSAHDPHPALALLLSTSGSTGSPKLVRLSATGVQANAESIATVLDIRASDRAPVSLPFNYCYGLSVINSNLLRGAALLLPGTSVVSKAFWAMFRDHGATSLHGVPYTFDLLARADFAAMDLPSLRYITQAGGALPPRRVRELAELGQRRGWRFFVMYGQTEATARMAYLPPELAASNPGAIGRPIPGGSFEIVRPRPSAPGTTFPGGDDPADGPGELVYRGPNVMMGYAENARDLAAGQVVDALATGDLARRGPGGLYELVGRGSRFVKPFGLRIDLDRVERLLSELGYPAACVGVDDVLVAVVDPADPADPANPADPAGPAATTTHTEPVGTGQARTEKIRVEVAAAIQAQTGLPAGQARVVVVPGLPRRPNGKVDYPAVAAVAAVAAPRDPVTTDNPPTRLRIRFGEVLNRPEVPDTATFVDLGGDSLTYVQLSLEIERALGWLPSGWPTIPVGELERMGVEPATDVGPAGARAPRGLRAVEVDVVLRAAAIVLVVSNHIGLFSLLGGAHLLLVAAGWNCARFGLVPGQRGVSRRLLRSAARIAVPSMLWLAGRIATSGEGSVTNVLLVDNYARDGVPGYWFVEVLVQTLLVLAALFAIPAVRRLERRHDFAVAVAVLGAALVASLAADPDVSGGFPTRLYVTHGALWFFVLGWAAQRATTGRRKVFVIAVAAGMLPGYFDDAIRETIVGAGLLAMMFLPRLLLPRAAVAVAASVSNASLYTYLTHFAVYEWALPHAAPLVVLFGCLGVGIGTWMITVRLCRMGWPPRALSAARPSATRWALPPERAAGRASGEAA